MNTINSAFITVGLILKNYTTDHCFAFLAIDTNYEMHRKLLEVENR